MFNCENLSIEILNNIFERLDKYDIGQSSLTCRAWNSVAQPILFKNLRHISDRDLNKLIAILPNNKLKLSPGRFVKVIDIYSFSDKFDVALLDKLFPKLEVIDITYSDPSLHDKLYQLIMDEKFSSLIKIPSKKLDQGNFDMVMARKDQLKVLEFEDDYFNENVMKRLFKNIHIFSKLNKFKLFFHRTKAAVSLETLFSKDLPTLERIDIAFILPARLFVKLPMDMNTVQSLPSVRDIRISNQFFANGGESYLYFMKKFPNVVNLQTSFQKYDTPIIADSHKVPSVECLTNFLLYLYNMEGEGIAGPMLTNQITTQVVDEFLKQALDRKSGRELRLRIAFDVHLSKLDLDKVSKYAAFIGTFNRYCDNEKSFELKVVYKSTLKNVSPQPYLELIKSIQDKKLEHLTIGNNFRGGLAPQKLPISIDTTLDHLNNLKTLRIHKIWTITFSDLENRLASTLENLTFKKCNLNEEIFPKISNTSPNLKMIEINTCHYIIKNSNPEKRVLPGNISIDMPHTNLRNLSIVVCLETVLSEYKSAFIKLKTANEKTRYCKLIRPPISDYDDDFDGCSTRIETRKKGYTEDDFKKCVKDKKCMVYDIYCESVAELTVYAEKHESKVYLEKKI